MSVPRARALPYGAAPGEPLLEVPFDLSTGPVAIGLLGNARPILNLTACALARTWDPNPFWFHIDDPREPPTELESEILARISPANFARLERSRAFLPDDSTANLGVWELVRGGKVGGALSRLTDYLRLPLVAREFAGRAQSVGRPTVGVAANIDRISPLYPDEPESSRRIFEAVMGDSVTFIMTSYGRPRDDRFAAENVLHLTTGPSGGVGATRVAIESSTAGPFGTLPRAFPLDRLGPVVRLARELSVT